MTRAILRAASTIVPADLRADWLDEWRAELWHVAHSERRPTAFVLGAFRDAFWLRRNSPGSPLAFAPASPLRCIGLLAVVAAITFLGAPRPRTVPIPGLLTISASGHGPSVAYESYRGITAHASRAFSGLAFAAPARARVQCVPGRAAEVSLAVATPSLAELVGVPAPRGEPAVLLSDGAWRAWFASDPRVAGRFVEIGGRPVRIAGVMPFNVSRAVPVAVWMLTVEEPPADVKGFVLAKAKAPPKPGARWWMSAPNRRGAWDRFECASLEGESPVMLNVAMMFLALLLLPISTPVRLGQYPATRHSPRGLIRLRRWCFLGLKLAFLVPAVYWGALMMGVLAPGLEAHACLIGYSFAFRWILLDQRRRCPVCLRVLTNPTPIGCASQTFLEWYGAEFLCARGHGLLHVPEIPTSYSMPRWMYLDPSWTSLFSAGARGSVS